MPLSLHAFFRPFTRLLPSGLPLPILSGPLRGKKWIAGAAAGDGKGMSVVVNQYEAFQAEYAVALLNNSQICFDLGANVGFYTLLFSIYAKAVYAFEPLPRNLKYLIRLIDINRMTNAHIIPCAVSDTTKVSYFSKGYNHSLGKLDQTGTVPVLVTTCDRFVEETGVIPDLLKIDVEGSEVEVLQGARKLLKSRFPTLLLSIHGEMRRAGCLQLLKEIGYQKIIPINSEKIEDATVYAVHGGQ